MHGEIASSEGYKEYSEGAQLHHDAQPVATMTPSTPVSPRDLSPSRFVHSKSTENEVGRGITQSQQYGV